MKFKCLISFAFVVAWAGAPGWLTAQVQTLTFAFNQPAQLTASAGVDTVICAGQSATLNGSANGGTSPFTYSWTPATNLSSPSIANPVANPGDTTTYSLSITDANGCSSSDDIVLNVDVCVSNTLPGIAAIEIYPNPNNGSFRLNVSLLKQVQAYQLTILDLSGRTVYAQEKGSPEPVFSQEIVLKGMARGIYSVKMVFDGTVLERKIIVQ